MIAGIAKLLGNERNYFLFDSFQGLLNAREIDGDSAIKWQSNKTSNNYYNNCSATEQDGYSAMKIARITNSTIIKGWFKDSLQNVYIENGISILRMDADWYDSTLEILNHLFSKVHKGGIIIIDDYFAWDGCSKAVHDFLSINKCAEKIRTHHSICYIIKR